MPATIWILYSPSSTAAKVAAPSSAELAPWPSEGYTLWAASPTSTTRPLQHRVMFTIIIMHYQSSASAASSTVAPQNSISLEVQYSNGSLDSLQRLPPCHPVAGAKSSYTYSAPTPPSHTAPLSFRPQPASCHPCRHCILCLSSCTCLAWCTQ